MESRRRQQSAERRGWVGSGAGAALDEARRAQFGFVVPARGSTNAQDTAQPGDSADPSGSESVLVDAVGVDAADGVNQPIDAALPRPARRLGYPAFTRRWLRGRLRAFGAVLVGLAAAVVLGVSVQPDAPPLEAALQGAAAFLVGMGGVAFAGTTLATLVRHARRPLGQERWLVVGALLVGVALAAAIDGWASAVIASTVAGPEPSANLTPAGPLFALALYYAFGGWLALPAYWSEPGKRLAEAQRLQLEQLKRDKQELGVRLGVLQAQVEPLFLFNTLGNIRALITQRPDDAAALLDALVTYLRAAIPRLQGTALEHTRAYLEIMRLRLERLSYRVEADDSLLAHQFIPLLLLTLVENAVKHGVEPSTGPGEIVVRAVQQGRSLCLSVEDTGVGLSELGPRSSTRWSAEFSALRGAPPARSRCAGSPLRWITAALDHRCAGSPLRWITAGAGDTVRFFPLDEALAFVAKDRVHPPASWAARAHSEGAPRATSRFVEFPSSGQSDVAWPVNRTVRALG